MFSSHHPTDQERVPAGLMASIFPVVPAPRRIWRRRGMALLLAVPIELLLSVFLSRWLSRLLPIPLLLTLDEAVVAVLLMQAALGLTFWRQRWPYWLLLAATVLGLSWLAGWPSPLALMGR